MPRRTGERMLVRSLLVGVAAVLVAASTAAAGTYSHYACMYPNGRLGAPISDGSNGWRAVGKDIPGYTAYDDCANGGAFGVRLARDATSHAADSYGWRYFPPIGTSVSGFSIAMTSFSDPNLGEVDVAQDGDRYFYRNIRGGDQGSSGSP